MADVDLSVGFEVDEGDLQTALQSQVEGLSEEFSNVSMMASSLVNDLRGLVSPMRELRDLAKELSESFSSAKDAASDIKQSIASTRLQTGLGTATGAPTGGAGTSVTSTLGSVLGPGLGIAAGVAGLAPTAIGVGGIAGLFGGRSILQAAGVTDMIGSPIAAMRQGMNPATALMMTESSNLAGMYGGTRGLMQGLGQGPVGMISQVAGGYFGARGGFNIGEQMLGTGGGIIGAEMGRQMVSGMTERYITEAMSRYPGYLQQAASLAQPRLYGGTRAMQGRVTPLGRQMGYGPEEFGGELASLYQGFGGGELTEDTIRTSLSYSRAYGVAMGQQSGAIGGLLNTGGQLASAETRENVLLRVMTDAVSSGFGRRLPEFAQAIGGTVGTIMSGPSIVRSEAMQDLIGSISQATSNLARSRGIGLEGAGRMIQPYAGATGGMLSNLMQGGGDPYSTSLLWQTNRSRFGDDPYQMMRGLAELQENPLGQEAVSIMAPAIQQLLRQSSTDYGAAASLQQLFSGLGQNISFQGIDDLIQNRGALVGATTNEATGIIRSLIGAEGGTGEGQDLRGTIEEVGERGREVMQEQLGELQNQSRWAWQQYGLSASMAQHAQQFHQAQIAESKAMVSMMKHSALGTAITSLASLRQGAAEELGTTRDLEAYMQRMVTGGLAEVEGWTAQEMMTGSGAARGTIAQEVSVENVVNSAQNVATRVSNMTQRAAGTVRNRAQDVAERLVTAGGGVVERGVGRIQEVVGLGPRVPGTTGQQAVLPANRGTTGTGGN